MQAADAIKAMLSPVATVVREGVRTDIDADQLVPGDIVAIKSGDKVPADLRLLEATNLQVGNRLRYHCYYLLCCCSTRLAATRAVSNLVP